MIVRAGQNIENRTRNYLVPVLKEYGPGFASKYNETYKIFTGVHDSLLDGSPYINDRCFVIVLDKLYKPKDYESFMEYVKTQDCYVLDYCPEADINKSRLNALVLKVPEKYHHAYDMFIQGRYSEMYSEEDIKLLFKNKPKVQEIFFRANGLKKAYVDSINEYFCTTFEENNINHKEFDMPPLCEEEILNYDKMSGESYFIYNYLKINSYVK